jgi:hypothetical protein
MVCLHMYVECAGTTMGAESIVAIFSEIAEIERALTFYVYER